MKIDNITLRNKLKNYSILAGSVLAANTVNGQIIYHDLTPNVVLTDFGEYNLDLNGDSARDYEFEQAHPGDQTWSERIYMRNKSASFLGRISYTTNENPVFYFGLPYVVNSGDRIGANQLWVNYQALENSYHNGFREGPGLVAGYYNSENIYLWGSGETRKFIGLRIKSDTGFNYGWVRLSVAPGGRSMTLIDFAYQQTINMPIIAGDTGGCATGPFLIVAFNKNLRDGDTTRLKLFGDIQPGQTYDWFRGSEKIAITKYLHSIVVSEPGEYWAKVKSSDGCAIVSDTVQVRDLSSSEPDQLGTMENSNLQNIYAADKVLHVNLNNSDYLKNGVISIYNSAGEQFIRQNISSQDFTMSLQLLNAGIYFVKLTNGKNEINRKIFIE